MSPIPDPTATGRKRILFLVPAFRVGLGGSERFISVLLRYLDHTLYECHLGLTLGGPAFLENVPSCVAVHDLGVSRMRYALPAIIRLVWKLRPETLVSTVSRLNFMLMIARPFLPRATRLVLTEVTTPSLFIRVETRYPRLWAWLYRHLYPRADKIICLSNAILEDLVVQFGIPREKLTRIYGPVDVAMLRQVAAASSNPYAGSGPNLVVAARLHMEKGVDVLLDAMPAVVEQFPSARLAILGEGPQERELKAQAARLSLATHLDFMGFQNSPWPYIKHADLLVLPSRLEGLPSAMLEAIALGTPVVATDSSGGVREIQQATPGSVDLVPVEDATALASGIITALRRRGQLRRRTETEESLGQFDPQRIAAEYGKLFLWD